MEKITKTDAQWRAQLTTEEYKITRQKGTEPAFTGRFWNTTTPGKYFCIGCGALLFNSEAKFDAGCGWPSYSMPANPQAIRQESDSSHAMIREEVLCQKCDAHLGHVFTDGPQPTGLRYCINSLSLNFKPTP